MLLTHVLAFAVGAALVWFLRRGAPPAPPAPAPVDDDPMRAPDPELDAEIIEYIGENRVFHINDICLALEHPKGARFVRAHVHKLLEEGKIRYRNMVYSI